MIVIVWSPTRLSFIFLYAYVHVQFNQTVSRPFKCPNILDVHTRLNLRIKTTQGQGQIGLNAEMVLILKQYNAGLKHRGVQQFGNK